MRWCRLTHRGATTYGVVEGDDVAVMTAGPLGEARPTGDVVPLADARLEAPVVPATFYCVGYNYAAHVGSTTLGRPARPEVGYRAVNALVGAGRSIVRPADCTGRLEAEGELVAVIGRRLRRCSRDEAQDAILGWTIGNDVSARDWQREDRTLWRAKNSDTFKPMGPWIDTEARPLDAGTTTTVSVDGVVRSEFPTPDMIFDPFDYLVEISRYITVAPGDVIWMGTDTPVELPLTGSVTVSITGLGSLSNPIVTETNDALEESRT